MKYSMDVCNLHLFIISSNPSTSHTNDDRRILQISIIYNARHVLMQKLTFHICIHSFNGYRFNVIRVRKFWPQVHVWQTLVLPRLDTKYIKKFWMVIVDYSDGKMEPEKGMGSQHWPIIRAGHKLLIGHPYPAKSCDRVVYIEHPIYPCLSWPI